MVTDQEIASCVETLLRQQSSDPANAGAAVSLTGVVHHLESKLGIDLSDKTGFIRDQIDLLLGPPRPILPPPPQFIFPSPHQILFQSIPPQLHMQMIGGGGGVPFGGEMAAAGGFQYPGPMGVGGGGGVVAVAPPQQYGHGPVAPGGRPIGSVLDLRESAPPVAKRRGGPGGLSKVCGVSPELQAIVGEPAMPRTQIVKQLWAYIRKNNLQDPNNKRKIVCNDELRLVFETDCTDMFKMNKLLAKHIIPLEDTKDMGPDSKKLKVEDVGTKTETDVAGQSLVISGREQPAVISASEQSTVVPTSEQPVIDSTSEQPVVISDALASFFGTEGKEMLRSEALRRLSDYIKDNKLQDPANSTMIRCDSRLQQLFGCENHSMMGIPEMLSYHLFRKS